MLARWRRNRKELELAHTLYCILVEQARSEVFYRDFEVEDTLEGRLDLILLHMFIMIESLKDDTFESDGLLQKLQEVMIRDIDRSLREIGVGDMNVGKQMRHVGASLLGRVNIYHKALADDDSDQMLNNAIERNVYREQENPHVSDIAVYIRRALDADLINTNRQAYLKGAFKFPALPLNQK